MRRNPPPLESEVQRQILRYLTTARIFHWRANTGAMKGEYNGRKRFVRFGSPGVSDILGILPGGRFLAIEVKRPRLGRLTADQAAFQANVRTAGGLAVCVCSVEELRIELRAAGYPAP
jgi:hypothetical protein